MTKEYVCLSFFKANKLNYYFEKPFITFACPNCNEEALMDSINSKWICSCGESGTLITLQNQVAKMKMNMGRVFNPKAAMSKINHKIDSMICSSPSESNLINDLFQLRTLTNELTEYFLKNKKPS